MKKFLAWLLVVVWMGMIFGFSAQPASVSRELSREVTMKVIEPVQKALPSKKIKVQALHRMVRKNAHFLNYLVLGLLLLNALRQGGASSRRSFWTALLICMIYAATDEFHQLFVPGRSGELRDIGIDSIGAFVGLVLCSRGQFFRKIR